MHYVKECLQLLYWIYFKPYTLKRHVREICPEISNPYEDNIYRRSAEARSNPRLKRYDDQCWWLSVLAPIAVVVFYAPLAESAARLLAKAGALQFNWLLSSMFILGWLLGQLIVRAVGRKLGENAAKLVAVVALALLFFTFVKLVKHGIVSKEAFGMMSVVTGVMVGGVAGGMAVAMFSMAFGVAGSVASGESFILGVLRVPFWLPELLWMFPLRFWPSKAAAKLRFLPPQFDQLIYFPLPFLPGLIAEAYRENQAAARQCINYLISSTNQQKSAGKAMLLIAAESFAACRSAGEIAAVKEQLDWLPKELAGKITDCLELSQDVAAALEASSPYRQAQRLEQVCAKIEQRRNALASASAREATTLGGVLDQWQGILRTACRTLHETAQRSGELPQVYLPGPPLEPGKAGSLFKGRKDIFRHIESLLLSAQPPTLVMHGNRRSGKSSALRYLPKQMPADILPLFVDCQGAAVSSSLHGLADRIANQLISSARETHRLTLPPPDKDELRLDPFAALLAWLDAAEQAAPGKTFLLCLDEFERIDEIVTTTSLSH